MLFPRPLLALAALGLALPASGQTSTPGAPEVRVAFDPLSSGGPKGKVDYYKYHYAEGYGRVDLTLAVEGVVPPGGVDVHYTVSGTAVEGVHYQRVVGSSSPVHFAAGDVRKTVSVRILAGVEYFDERSIVLQLPPSASYVAEPGADEVRLHVRSLIDPPRIEFQKPKSRGGYGDNFVTVRLKPGSPETREVISLYWRQTNAGEPDAAVLGVDYAWFPGGEPGSRRIDAAEGQKLATIPFQVLPTATDGRVLEIALDHELSDRSDENLVTFTHDMRMELTEGLDEVWPGDRTDNITGPGSVLQKDKPLPISSFVDEGKLHPETGEPLQGLLLNPGAVGPGYHRKSFENQVHCGGPLQLLPLAEYTRWSWYVDLPSAQSPVTGYSRFVRLSIRDRAADENHAVVFDRESPDGGLLGSVVSTATGDWGVFTTKFWNHSSEFGVEEENGRTRIWVLYHAEDPTHVGHPTSRIMFPLWFGPDGTSQLVGGVNQNAGKGLLFSDPYLEMSASPLSGAPGRFWEKRGNYWQPRGRATITPGGRNVHAFTIELL